MSPQQAAAARARGSSAPAPLSRPPAPRRVSGPARRTSAPAAPQTGIFVRVLDAPFLDRLVRGRVWIALVATALLGIVAMQVAILRLGASIGESVAQIQRLTQANESAETTIAEDEPGRNVANEASSLGMVYPPAGNVVYLRYSPAEASIAAHSITPPTAPLFTPAAPSLTAPIAPVAPVEGLDTTSDAQVAASTTTTSTDTTTSTTDTTTDTTSDTTPGSAAPTQGGSTSAGASPAPPPASSTTTTLGAAGGSAAPSTGATG